MDLVGDCPDLIDKGKDEREDVRGSTFTRRGLVAAWFIACHQPETDLEGKRCPSERTSLFRWQDED